MSNRIRTTAGLCAVAAFGLLAAPALADRRDHNRIEARLKSYQEVPAVSSVASGRFKATLDSASQTLSYELSYSGLEGEVRQAHIHFGQRGVNGGIMVWLCQTATNVSPVPSTPQCLPSGASGTISAADVIGAPAAPPAAAQGAGAQGVVAGEFAEMLAAVRAGVAYVNVHTSKFPGGEIRGQLKDDD